jgi:hypothetical protein
MNVTVRTAHNLDTVACGDSARLRGLKYPYRPGSEGVFAGPLRRVYSKPRLFNHLKRVMCEHPE